MANRTWTGEDSANPNDWSLAANWREGSVPINADDVFLIDNATSITAGLDQSAVTLASLNIDLSYTGNIGLDDTSFLIIGSTIVNLGQNLGSAAPSGAPRLNLDLRGAAAVTVFGTSSNSTDANRNPLRMLFNSASSDLFIRGGSAAIADDGDQTSTLGDINVTGDGVTLNIGDGVTYDNLNVTRGSIQAFSMPTTKVDAKGGDILLQGVDTLALLEVDSTASVVSNISGTITLITGRGGSVDFSQSNEIRTVTDIVVSGSDFDFIADFDILTITNGLTFASNLPILSIGSTIGA